MVAGVEIAFQYLLGDDILDGALERATHGTGAEAGVVAGFDDLACSRISKRY